MKWVFHPAEKAPTTARVALGQGRVLHLDESGSRWLTSEEADVPRSAPFGAEEPLVGFGRDGSKYAFLGRKGGVFVSHGLLKPFEEVRRPPREVVAASLSQGVIVATTAMGNLLRSENWGRTWQEQEMGGFVFSSAMSQDGVAVAVTLPEGWKKSEDRGRSWTTLDGLSVGPLSLRTTAEGAIVAETPRGPLAFDGERFVPAQPEPSAATEWTMPRFASADAVRDGLASIGDGYWALASDESAWVGSLGGPLSRRRVVGLGDCGPYRVAQSGRHVAVVCVVSTDGGSSPKLGLFRSNDGGGKFVRVPVSLRGRMSELVLALSDHATLALSGVCSPELSQPGCSPYGVHVLAGKSRMLSHLGLPGVPLASALAFSGDERLWAAGRRNKDGHALAFTTDVGRVRSSSAKGETGPALEVHSMVDLHRHSTLAPLSDKVRLEILPEAEGYLNILVKDEKQLASSLLSPQAEVLAAAPLPAGAVDAHGAGRKLLALDEAAERLWESTDGGLTWNEVALPRSPCSQERGPCAVDLACTDAGCVIGTDLTRVGWGARESDEVGESDEPKWSAKQFEQGEAYACRLSERPWLPLGPVKNLPDIRVAALGTTAWSQVRGERKTGQVDALHVQWRSEEIQERTLLPPVAPVDEYALFVSEQVEGSAALRYRVPQNSRASRMLSDVEIAWDNRITDVIGQGRLPGEHAPLPGDYKSQVEGINEASPGLLSIAGAGVYLRLHHPPGVSQATYFFTTGGVEQVESPFWPTKWLQEGSREMVRVGTMHSPLLFFDDRRLVVRAVSRDAGGYTLVPHLLGLPDAAAREIGQAVAIGYVGDRIGFVSIQASPDGERRSARMTLLGTERAFEPPFDVPLNVDLPEPPPGCTMEARRQLARIVAPSFPARSHEVVIEDPGGPALELSSGDSIIFGKEGSACLAALEANPSNRVQRSSDFHRALLFFDEKGIFGWLFRVKTDAIGGTEASARPLTCSQ